MGHIWRARSKGTAAYFSAERYGCPGGSFFLGFHKPQSRTIINYVSSGIRGGARGSGTASIPEALSGIFEVIDPVPAKAKYCVVKPVTMLQAARRRRWSCSSPGPNPCAACTSWPAS